MIIAFTQLAIVVVWLLTSSAPMVTTLGTWTLYVQWLVILNCTALCTARSYIATLGSLFAIGAVLMISLAVLLTMEVVAAAWSSGFSEWQIDFRRLAQFALANVLLVSMLLRFFNFLATLENRNKAESQSRIEALQSRIQPHFLFNSLNTISELTATQPEQAEQAINSLSMLFRASLENNRKSHTLAAELKLCERYIELERWRVADRLTIHWEVHVEQAARWSIPKLILQPLIENAIVHGVQHDGMIEIWVDVRETNKQLSIKVENALGDANTSSSGNGIALENIKERLIVMYDDQQTFRVKSGSERYSVIMQFPKVVFSSGERLS